MFAPPIRSPEDHFFHALQAARDAHRRAHETPAEAREREYEELVGELRAMTAEGARREQRKTELVRTAGDREYWKLEGCSSLAQWLAQITKSDYGIAKRVTVTSEALRVLPALDEALSSGVLTLDQVAAAAPYATPETDDEIARAAVGKAPSQIARAARKLVPPRVEDDAALYKKRALHLNWVNGDRELVINGRLPLEQGLAFEQAIWAIALPQRAADKQDGIVLEWHQSAADALVTLAESDGGSGEGFTRSRTTLIVHLSPDAPALLEGAGPISPETAERLCCDARRLYIQPHGRDLKHSGVERCASYAQMRALYLRSGGYCQYPGCTATHKLQAHHMHPWDHGGLTVLSNLILLCHRHHKHLHDNHIRAGGNAEQPVFTDPSGHAITAHQPHAPPG